MTEKQLLKQQILMSAEKRGAKTWYSIFMDVDEQYRPKVMEAINELVAEGELVVRDEPEIQATVYARKA